jgi:hypothetical protein
VFYEVLGCAVLLARKHTVNGLAGKLQMIVNADGQRARISIANQSNCCLRTASHYIENIGRGEFSKAERR